MSLSRAIPPFTSAFEAEFATWIASYSGSISDQEYFQRSWVLNNPGRSPPFEIHSSFVTYTKDRYKVVDTILHYNHEEEGKAAKLKIVVKSSEVLGRIRQAHVTVLGHVGQDKTFNYLSEHYWGITRLAVRKVLQNCAVCAMK